VSSTAAQFDSNQFAKRKLKMRGLSIIDPCFVLELHANSRERKMEDERNICYGDVHHCVREAIVYGMS